MKTILLEYFRNGFSMEEEQMYNYLWPLFKAKYEFYLKKNSERIARAMIESTFEGVESEFSPGNPSATHRQNL